MSVLALYVISIFVFLAVDAVWLTNVMKPLFDREVGPLLREEMRFSAAAAFYALYIAGILYFCTFPGLKMDSIGLAAFNGLALGFMAYGTYEFTNMTTLKGWTWTMVATDTGWGMMLTAGTATAGVIAGRWLGMAGSA